MNDNIYLSVILPVRSESKNLKDLHKKLLDVCYRIGKRFEIIYVENGSTDNSLAILKKLRGAKVIILRWSSGVMKSGQTAALDAGIKEAKGDIIVTMDSDLQNPPEEIPKLLEKLSEGYDIVSGWRKKRKDNFVVTTLSRFGSLLRMKFINPGVHDLGCTLKAYKRECFEGIDLYGEMHRYIVAILKWKGFRIAEIEVEHKERKNGKSKYNWKKMFRGFVDMWQIWFLEKYSDRPLHLFGISGCFLGGIGILSLVTLGILRLFKIISLSNSIWPLIAVLLIIVGLQFFIFGIMLDMLIRNYYAQGKEKSYSIKEIITNDK